MAGTKAAELLYELDIEFEYAHKGDLRKAEFITLYPPTSRNMSEVAALKQAFFRSLPQDDESGEKEEAETEIKGSQVMALISMSVNVELSTVLLTARELFSAKGIADVDGEEKLTKPLIDAMDPNDFYTMTGEYIANFIIASALRKLKKS